MCVLNEVISVYLCDESSLISMCGCNEFHLVHVYINISSQHVSM